MSEKPHQPCVCGACVLLYLAVERLDEAVKKAAQSTCLRCGAPVAVLLTNSDRGYCRNHAQLAYNYNRGAA